MAVELLRNEADRAKAARYLIDVEEEERRRLALEVHDVVSPNLAAVLINLNLIEVDLPCPLETQLELRLTDVKQLIKATNESLQNICANLRPASLDYSGLYAAVDNFGQQFAKRTGIIVEMTGGHADDRLPAQVETLLFRIVQEALTNCGKHAQASRVRIELSHHREHACLEISDDGVGFDAENLVASGHRQGLGLLTMAERAKLAGGRFRIVSRPGQGTNIMVEI